ncbi:MAG: ABC transporter permease [Lachnospiraceae bacterium]|nr:ABC transporter permease [Lachnospiraceae bacterium]
MRIDHLKLFFLLNKRLLKKRSFIIILCLIPALVLGLKLVSERESGIVRIALVNEGSREAGLIIDEMLERDSVFLFYEYDDEEPAKDALLDNRIDAVWVFPRDYEERVSDVVLSIMGEGEGRKKTRRAVDVYEREDNVLLQLSRMELYGAMYSDLSFSLFKNYIDKRIAFEDTGEDELKRYYNSSIYSGSLFDYRNGNEMELKAGGNYLFTPLRGILLLIVLLGGLAASMYYRDDLDKEIFTWMPVGNKWVFEHIYLLTALIDCSVVVLITFFATGLAGSVGSELLLMFMFVLSGCCFCSIIRKVTFNLRSLATLIPILMLLMLVICPVFIYIRQLRLVQLLFPPTYYLMSQNNTDYFNYFVIYLVVTIALDVLSSLGSRCSS